MKKRNITVALGAIALLGVICILAIGGFAYWALNNPEMSASLKQFNSSLSDMTKLQQEVIAAYPADSIQVGIKNSHLLTVSLINSSANKLSGLVQKAQAKEIALFAKNHYDHMNGIDTIVVAFVKQDGSFGFSTNLTNNYVFKLSDLP